MVNFLDEFREKYSFYFIYLFAIASAVSISAMTVIISIFFVIYFLDIKSNIKKSPKDFALFLYFYIWRIISSFLNGHFAGFVSNFFHGIWDKSSYVFLSNIKIDKEKIIKFVNILLLINSLILLYALAQKFLGLPSLFKTLFTSDMMRFKGYHSHPLRFAGYYSSVCIIAFSFGLFYSRRYLYIFTFLFLGLLLNGSRTYWFSVVLTVLLVSFIKNRKVFLIVFLSVIVYIFSFFMVFKSYTDRINQAVNISSYSSNVSGSHMNLRLNFWKAGFDIFLKNPFFGTGGKITDYLKPYMERGEIDNTAHCHSNYIKVMAENGILGLIILLWIFVYFIKKYFIIYRYFKDNFSKAFSVSVMALFVNIVLAGLTEHNFATFVLWGFVSFYMGIYESYLKSK
ncbi:MAG TPA: O-antigen ligase family protein [Elusimicrobiales bacterium]|nr:O-antigen ligase family protein [Elusimicrobiales bacterium]